MQGPAALLNVWTIPPGALPGNQRIVIDGVRGAIFEYGNGSNALLSSWASSAGFDPFGNPYPQGFNIGVSSVFSGTNFIINSAGIFFYNGTPAFGNPPMCWMATSTIDPFGNAVTPGLGATLGAVSGGILTPLSVQPASIASLTASLIGNLGVLNPNPYFIGGDSSGWNGNINNPTVTTSVPAGNGYKYALRQVSGGAGEAMTESNSPAPFPVVPGQQIQTSAWVNTSGTSVGIGNGFQDASHTFISSSNQVFTVPANTWTQLSTVQTVPAGIFFAYPRVADQGAGDIIFAQAIICLPQVPGGLVQAGTITATQIAAATIDVTRLAAGIVYAGIVDATTITAATFVGSTYKGTNFIINSSGAFFYSGTPAAGNLIASIAPASGSDSFGNAYVRGPASYGTSLSTVTQLDQGVVNVYGTTPSSYSNAGSMQAGIGVNQEVMTLFSPLLTGSTKSQAVIEMDSAVGGGIIKLEGASAQVTGVLNANDPSFTSIDESWHTATPLQNSWTAGVCRYKKLAFNAVWVHIEATHAATSGNVQIFTMPTHYIPVHSIIKTLDFIISTNWAASQAENPQVRIDTSGNVTLDNLPAGTTNIQFDFIYPLD